MTVFCDNKDCCYIEEGSFCGCDKLNIVSGVCAGSYRNGRNAYDGDVDERLKAENAKLRELASIFCYYMQFGVDYDKYKMNGEDRKFMFATTYACDVLLKIHKRNDKLRAENAKLRELVLDMRTCIEHACMCEFCPLFVSEDMNERRCIADMKAHMRELGVDVDKC